MGRMFPFSEWHCTYQTKHAQACIYGKKQLAQLWQSPREESNVNTLHYRKKEKQYLTQETGLPPERIFFLEQVHGSSCHHIKSHAHPHSIENNQNQIYYAEGDALYTQETNVLLVVRTADCLPFFIVLAGESEVLVGLVHAGWRGLKAKVVYHALKRMLESFAIEGNDLTSLMVNCICGPYAGLERYEVGRELAALFPRAAKVQGKRYLLDLAAIAREQTRAALSDYAFSKHWEKRKLLSRLHYYADLEGCTMKCNDHFFSHRCGDFGRNLNTIWLPD